MNLSNRIKMVSPSQTLAISQKAAEMKSKGIDVVSFGAGEPDFNTPSPIVNAAKAALDEGFTHYAPVAGMPELKKCIADHIFDKLNVRYEPSQIIATCGAKSAIFIVLQVVLNPGDEVVVPAPYWVSYPEQVKLAGGKPIIVKTGEENGFKITAEEFSQAVTDNTKVVIINSPSNPTGSIYTKGELSELIKICISKDILIVADEIYDRLVYDGKFCSVINAHPSAAKHTIYINGVSKGYAMTGWRMGYAAGPQDIISAMTKYQSQLLTCIPPFVQKAVVAALKSPPDMIEGMIDQFSKRRDLVMDLIGKIPDISCVKPDGAFYAFMNVEKYLGRIYNKTKIDSSQKLAKYLLDEAHVAVVPGSAFGMEGFLRLSFATSEEEIKKGINRIGEALKKLL